MAVRGALVEEAEEEELDASTFNLEVGGGARVDSVVGMAVAPLHLA